MTTTIRVLGTEGRLPGTEGNWAGAAWDGWTGGAGLRRRNLLGTGYRGRWFHPAHRLIETPLGAAE